MCWDLNVEPTDFGTSIDEIRQLRSKSRARSRCGSLQHLLRQEVRIYTVTNRRAIWLQRNASQSRVAAIQSRVENPSPQPLIVPQSASDLQSKESRVCVDEAGDDTAIAAVIVDQN